MKRKFILMTLLLISLFVANSSINFAQESTSSVPAMLQNIKGKEELKGYINKIESVRSNINTINITSSITKEDAAKTKKQIKYYLSELSSINTSLKSFETRYSDSQPDLLFANQIKILTEVYEMSLNQQLSLLDAVLENSFESSKLFYSDYLVYIYYYLNLGDQMLSYINTFYNL